MIPHMRIYGRLRNAALSGGLGFLISLSQCIDADARPVNDGYSSLECISHGIEVDYPALRDAEGLALLMGDDKGRKILDRLESRIIEMRGKEIRVIENTYTSALEDEMGASIDFFRTIWKGSGSDSDDKRDAVRKAIEDIRKTPAVAEEWIDKLFKRKLYAAGIYLEEDIGSTDRSKARRLLEEYDRLHSLRLTLNEAKLMRYFVQLDRVSMLNEERDAQLEDKTLISMASDDKEEIEVYSHYLSLLDNLERTIKKNSYLPYRKYYFFTGIKNLLKYMGDIYDAADDLDIDKKTALSLIIQESRGMHHLVSGAGAVGLTQLMDSAMKDIYAKRSAIEGADILKQFDSYDDFRSAVIKDPRVSIYAGLAHFKEILKSIDSMRGKYRGRRYFDWTNARLAMARYNSGVGSTHKAGVEHGLYAVHLAEGEGVIIDRYKGDITAVPMMMETLGYVLGISSFEHYLRDIRSYTSDISTMPVSEILRLLKEQS